MWIAIHRPDHWPSTNATDTLQNDDMVERGPEALGDPFDWVGRDLENKYRIEAVVGAGGFGVVYAARHRALGQRVAIKFLKLENLAQERRERFLSGFLEEGRIMSRLGEASAHVVKAIDYGAAIAPNGSWAPFLVLEWVDGMTLETDLATRTPRRSLADAVALLAPAARALDVAHSENVAHRDVKPANMIIGSVHGETTMRVVDFGVAKIMRDASGPEIATAEPGVRAFSIAYGAPEQFDRGFGATGPWTDVFALALVLVETVSGRRALAGEDLHELEAQATDPGRRPTLRALGVPTSDAIERVLLHALAVDPRNRYRRAGELWTALEHALRPSSDPLSKPSSRSRRTIIALVVAGVAVIAMLIASRPSDAQDDGTDPSRPVLPQGERSLLGTRDARFWSEQCFRHYVTEKKWGWAKAECDEAGKLGPTGIVKAQLLYNQGRIAEQAGKPEEALRDYDESLTLPNSPSNLQEVRARRDALRGGPRATGSSGIAP